MVLIGKETIQLHNIRMIEETLNFNFANDLANELLFSFKDAFWYFFQSADEVCHFVSLSAIMYLTR